MSDSYEALLSLIIPKLLVDYFDLVQSKSEGEILHLYFEKFNTPPEEYSSAELQ